MKISEATPAAVVNEMEPYSFTDAYEEGHADGYQAGMDDMLVLVESVSETMFRTDAATRNLVAMLLRRVAGR